MRIIKKTTVLLVAVLLVAISHSDFAVLAEDTPETPNDESNIEILELDTIIELGIWEDNYDGDKKVIVGWNEITSLSDIQKYELTLFKANGSLVGSAVEIPYQNSTAITNATYLGENWDYTYEFFNITENNSYYCEIRACFNEADIDGNINIIWSEYTQSESIEIITVQPMSLVIDSAEWTNNTTPQLTWGGVVVGAEGAMHIQYQMNDGDWVDIGWTGISGSGTFALDTLANDGEYWIKVRGKVDVTDSETGEIITVFGEESESVLYQLDAIAPVISISSPKSTYEFENKLKIKGSILDGGSGIKSWILEYECNNNTGVWKTITSGKTELGQNSTLANWNTSSLPIGFYTIRLKAIDNDVAKSVISSSVTVEKVNNSTAKMPTNVKATLIIDTNISAQISWEDMQNSGDVVYNVYRSLDEDFSEHSLVATDIENVFWTDTDILYVQDYNYRVSAIMQSQESETTVDFVQIKLDKMLGLQIYWTYYNFSTYDGSGYINVANGNFVYSSLNNDGEDMIESIVTNRIYNSQSTQVSSLGYGWDFSFNAYLCQEKDESNNLLGMILLEGDGSRHYFAYNYTTGNYKALKGVFMELGYKNITGEHILTKQNGTSYTFGNDLKLKKIIDSKGENITLNYDLENRLQTIENNEDEQVVFSYYQQSDINAPFYTDDSEHIGLLAQLMDHYGNTYLYTYRDGSTVLIAVSNVETNTVESYGYADGTNRLEKIIDSEGDETLLDYTEAASKVTRLTLPDGECYEISYLEDTTMLTDNEGSCTEYYYDINGCVSSIVKSDGDRALYIYNGNFQVIELTYSKYIDGDLTIINHSYCYDGTVE